MERLLLKQALEMADCIRHLREDSEAATASEASASNAEAEEDAAIAASWKARPNR